MDNILRQAVALDVFFRHFLGMAIASFLYIKFIALFTTIYMVFEPIVSPEELTQLSWRTA